MLFLLFLVAVISLSLIFFYIVFESPYRCINAILNADESSSFSFFETYSLSQLFFGCKALFLSILQGDSPGVHAFLEIPGIEFSFEKFSRSPKILFLKIFHLHLFDGVHILNTRYFPFLRSFWFFSWFGSSIPYVISFFLLLIICMAYFSMVNFISISWLCIRIVCIRVYNSFSWLVGWLVVWVLWRINLCRLLNPKFCLYVYTFNQRFLKESLVGKIFY